MIVLNLFLVWQMGQVTSEGAHVVATSVAAAVKTATARPTTWSFLMAYGATPEFQARFYELTPPHNLLSGLAVAAVLSCLSARLALAWGGWMARVQR